MLPLLFVMLGEGFSASSMSAAIEEPDAPREGTSVAVDYCASVTVETTATVEVT